MKKYLVETYYTCTFKTVHSLNELNEKSMADIDKRDDGIVEVVEVKLNNRKTKKIGDNDPKSNNKEKIEVIEKNIDKKKASNSYLPLSKLDLKVLIREISSTFKNFLEENNLDKKGKIYLSGRNSQHKNLVEILGESLLMDTFLVSPASNSMISSSNSMPILPSITKKVSSVSLCLCQVKSFSIFTSLN